MDERYVEEELQGGPGGSIPEDPNPADRIIATVTAPRRAFDGLLRAKNLNAVIGIGAVVLIIISFASTFVLSSSEVFQEQQAERMERTLEQMEDMEGMTDEDLEDVREGMELQSAGGVIGSLIGLVIFMPILLLILGLIVMGVSKAFEKGSESYIRYRHALAVATLGMIPMYLVSLLLAVIQLLAAVDMMSLGLHSLVSEDQTALHIGMMVFTIPSILWFVITGVGTASIARSGESGPIVTYAGIAFTFMAIYGVLASMFPMISPV